VGSSSLLRRQSIAVTAKRTPPRWVGLAPLHHSGTVKLPVTFLSMSPWIVSYGGDCEVSTGALMIRGPKGDATKRGSGMRLDLSVERL